MSIVRPSAIPNEPGVYRFFDDKQTVIYVGKAKNLRSRVSSYFAGELHPRTSSMISAAATVDWTIVKSDTEAFALEYSWIKEFEPRFNVKYRDDKSYPFLAVTLGEEFPRAQVVRGQRKKNTKYFGPFSQAWAIRETLDQLLRVFPVRTCSNSTFKSAKQADRACLLGYIDRCSAPCVGRVSAQEHRAIVDDFCSFMSGNTGAYVRSISEQMQSAVEELNYEKAARLRDDLAALTKVMEQNSVVLEPGTDADLIAVHADELEAAVQVFYVRDGRIRGKRGWVTERVEDISNAELMTHFLRQIYDPTGIIDTPREVLVDVKPADLELLETWLSSLKGSRVQVRTPVRGDKAALISTVQANAAHTLLQHRLRRSSDLTSRSAALKQLQDSLGFEESFLRIECIDISHLQGTSAVGSLVVFEDGLPKKSAYRRFTIKTVEGSDDVASIKEVVRRRFEHPDDSRTFAYEPGLLVVDGGKPQVNAARSVLNELGLVHIPVIGLAKRLEEVWLPEQDFPVILSRGSEGLYLLQRIRDEAHRFAIAFHRASRSKSLTASQLDQVPGLGEVKRASLMKALKSVRKISQASVEQLSAVDGIGPKLAETIFEHFQALRVNGGAPTGVNVTTGEIIEP
ncbi:unannotated protein [freshwater metagenome]|jgi:excinuclease ABC subunit C|uniref:Unannotated protein n=1 Tax=freshwater metagenome TaxID=449393 RepID=A0A6J7DN38_9ZZZZ|nr:excinuclease ABC subunit UvrC [Actinomycetota bacterium]